MPKRPHYDDNGIISKMFNLLVLCINNFRITCDDSLDSLFSDVFKFMYAALITAETNVIENITVMDLNLHYFEPVIFIKNKTSKTIISGISWPFIYDVMVGKYYSGLTRVFSQSSCVEPTDDILELNFDNSTISSENFYDKFKLSQFTLKRLILLYVCAEHAKTHYFLSLTGQLDIKHQIGDYLIQTLTSEPDKYLDGELT